MSILYLAVIGLYVLLFSTCQRPTPVVFPKPDTVYVATPYFHSTTESYATHTNTEIWYDTIYFRIDTTRQIIETGDTLTLFHQKRIFNDDF